MDHKQGIIGEPGEATVVLSARSDGGLPQQGSSRDREKWMDLECTLE